MDSVIPEVGQIWEDFEPIYEPLRGGSPFHRRKFRVVEIGTKGRVVVSSGCWKTIDEPCAVLWIEVDTDGKPPAKPRTVKVRLDRMKPKKGGYRLYISSASAEGRAE